MYQTITKFSQSKWTNDKKSIHKILIIIVISAIVPVINYAGLSAGQKQTRQECIDKVSENCEYICGVGADFYFPDQEEREFNNIEDSNQLEIRVAQRR